MLISHIHVSGCFENVLMIFWVHLGRNLLKGLVKFMEKGNSEDLMLFLNKNLTINIYKTYTKQLSTNMGSPFRGAFNCLAVLQNLLKFHLYSRILPP